MKKLLLGVVCVVGLMVSCAPEPNTKKPPVEVYSTSPQALWIQSRFYYYKENGEIDEFKTLDSDTHVKLGVYPNSKSCVAARILDINEWFRKIHTNEFVTLNHEIKATEKGRQFVTINKKTGMVYMENTYTCKPDQ